MYIRPARNRHGRGVRGPLVPTTLPRHASRSSRFDTAVLEAYAPIAERFRDQLAALDIAVDTVPRMRLDTQAPVLPDEVMADGPVPLGRVIPAGVDDRGRPTRARIVIFRMPIELRCLDAPSRQHLLRRVLAHLVAQHLNLLPEDVDPQAWGESS